MNLKNITSYILIIISIYKVVTSFTQNLEYGTLFSVQTNIWIYRCIWVIAGSFSAYSIYKLHKDKRQFSRK